MKQLYIYTYETSLVVALWLLAILRFESYAVGRQCEFFCHYTAEAFGRRFVFKESFNHFVDLKNRVILL